jgi:hypothetical protein
MKGVTDGRFPEHSLSRSLTDISPVVAPYVATVASRFGAKLHLLHVLRRFDWFVDTYVSQPSETDFKSIASDFERSTPLPRPANVGGFQG